MDITMLRGTFGPSPIEFLPAAQTAAEISARNEMLLVGAGILILTTVVVTVIVYQQIAEQHQFKVVRKPASVQEHFRE